eukprot:snap_masked-scaffold139_size317827-processed-gene-0.8 protein:Tk05002 transcript:snap_masked-scaffold139_size317827-processed-gene-0.8-mRNA-1 annotation:"golgi snap receptor complex member 1"
MIETASLATTWRDFDFEATSSSMSTTPMSGTAPLPSGSWEQLRKEASAGEGWGSGAHLISSFIRFQARQIENQIDVQLVAFSQLGTNYGRQSGPPPASDQVPLLAEPSNEFEETAQGISGLLARLSQINEGMSDLATGQGPSAAIHHTLQRHRDILLDYRQEYHKTKANIEAVMEREDLLSSVHRDINEYRHGVSGGGGRANNRMDLLLQETESARNSERMIDDQINIAIEARESLVSQRIAFKAIQTKLNDIANRFPVINSLVQRINLRKRRDTIILGLIVGLCLTFLIWYGFW